MSGLLDTTPAAAPGAPGAPGAPDAPDAPGGPSSSSRATVDPRSAWRKAKLPVAIGVAFAVLAVMHALATGGARSGPMDPDATDPAGARALATLLRDRGIDVRVVDEPTGAADTTVFVPFPVFAHQARPAALAAASEALALVVAEPDETHLEVLDVAAGVTGRVATEVVAPRCEHHDAAAAGAVRAGGSTFRAPEHATSCYPVGGEATFVEVSQGGGRLVTLFGSAAFMTNQHLGDDGNAALALRVLTRHPTVEWVYPRAPELASEDGEQGLFELLPHRVLVFTAQAFVVLLLLALWRARRLGPVVVEPLPVVVRAAEAVEGRARLYEGAHARGQAANALRAGLRDRLVQVLGLARDASPETMVAAITARTGRDAVGVGDLLYGPPPPDDAALVRLAAELDRLDNEVRAL